MLEVEITTQEKQLFIKLFSAKLRDYLYGPFIRKYLQKSRWWKWLDTDDATGWIGWTQYNKRMELENFFKLISEIKKTSGVSWEFFDTDIFDENLSYTTPENNHTIHWYGLLKNKYVVEGYMYLPKKSGYSRTGLGLMIMANMAASTVTSTDMYPLFYDEDPVVKALTDNIDKVENDLLKIYAETLEQVLV
jgi:hypothetical protein